MDKYVKHSFSAYTYCLMVLFYLFLCSCSGQPAYSLRIERGDTRTFETKNYIIVEECEGKTLLGDIIWKVKSIKMKDDEKRN